MSNKSAGESDDVTLRIQLARHIAAPVLNKGEVEQKKTGPKKNSKELNPLLSFVLVITSP